MTHTDGLFQLVSLEEICSRLSVSRSTAGHTPLFEKGFPHLLYGPRQSCFSCTSLFHFMGKRRCCALSYLQSRALSSSVPPSRSSALNSLEKILLWTKSFQSDTCLRTFKSCLGRMQNKNTVTGSTHWACPTAQQAPNVPGTESLQRGPISQYRVSI